MNTLKTLYKPSLALFTDLYQLTMAYGYWKSGLQDREAVFHLFFRKNPFSGGYAIACGLATALEFVEQLRFDDDDARYLSTLRGNDGQPLFEQEFIRYLCQMEMNLDIAAVPEGTVVFPHEPLIRVTGSLIQGQLLESALLNIINFQSLIATKASRVVMAAGGDPVLEFGLRRAQGVDGALSASRAAYIGGCVATSNVLAGRIFGIPVKGTHAHSWVMCFDDERQSFEAYAAAMPNNCVFLVDTYDSLEGVRKAVAVGSKLRARGHEMNGIRLDSGDLAYLSIEARKILDEGGFPNAVIVASNDLNEELIKSLKEQGASIGVWGVGTQLVTAFDQPALGGVYKLSAIRKKGDDWCYKLKLSEQAIKISNPGILQIRRFDENGQAVGDAIYDTKNPPRGVCTVIDPMDATRQRIFQKDISSSDLLETVILKGKRVSTSPGIKEIRANVRSQLKQFHKGIKRFFNPHGYPVGLEASLHHRKTNLILKARGVPVAHGMQ